MKKRAPIQSQIPLTLGKIGNMGPFHGIALDVWGPAEIQQRIFKLKQELEGIKARTFQGERGVLEKRLGKFEREVKGIAQHTAITLSTAALGDVEAACTANGASWRSIEGAVRAGAWTGNRR